jgi:hypothetical protein
LKEKGIVLSPAGPTTAPGGSEAVAAWVGLAGVVGVVGVVGLVGAVALAVVVVGPGCAGGVDCPGWPLAAPPLGAGVLAGAAGGAEPEPEVSLTLRKSTPVDCAVESSWYTSEGTSSSLGTALPRRATAE